MAIYKRGKTYTYRVYVGKDPITGKDKQVSKGGFRTKKDAQLAAALIERQFHNGEYIEPSRITFGNLSKEWIKHYSNEVKESSVRAREKALNISIERFGDTAIQQISKREYQKFIDDMAVQYSKNYVDSIHSSTQMAFKYAKDMNLLNVLPCEGIRRPKPKKTVEEIENDDIIEKFMEKEELEKFLLTAKNEGLTSDFIVFTTLAYTGLRIGELQALKWTDIDFDNHTLRVTKTYYNPNNNKKKYELLTPKTESSIRTITIDALVVNLLKLHMKEQKGLKEANHEFYIDKNFIFTGNEGYPLVYRTVADRMIRLLAKSGISKHVTPHSFRHTHTSLLIEANVHIKEIQERLGHADINTTMDIYARMTKGAKKEASTRFSNLMESFSKNFYVET